MDECKGETISGQCKGGHGRKSAATRQAILESAKTCFMQEGYEHVGVREIAGRAGVDPALVNRYFGSKEGLFAEAVSTKFDLSEILAGDRDMLGERLARHVLEKKRPSDGYDPLVALLRSASSEAPARMLRKGFSAGLVQPIASLLDGPDAVARAELIGSTILGLLVHRTLIGGAEVVDVERLVALIGPTLQGLIDGTG